MAFKYINPGYVALLDSNASASAQIVDRKKSKTGVAFNNIYSNVGITLPDFVAGDEFWGKFDFFVYSPSNSTNIYFCLPNTNGRGFYIYYPPSSTSTISISHRYDNSSITLISGLFEIVGFKWDAINTVTFHAILGNSSTAKLELWVSDNKFVSTGRAMAYSTSYAKKAILYADGHNVAFSNIIFSDEPISPKEQTLALPISATETDMALGDDGIYIADAANQTLLQSVDVSSLIETYGASSAITGIQLVGNPAYKTAAGLANLTALSKAGNVTAEHKSFSISDNTSAVIADGWKVENMTIADLQDMRFGWKVGE